MNFDNFLYKDKSKTEKILELINNSREIIMEVRDELNSSDTYDKSDLLYGLYSVLRRLNSASFKLSDAKKTEVEPPFCDAVQPGEYRSEKGSVFKKYELEKPIFVNGKETKTLCLREPTVLDLLEVRRLKREVTQCSLDLMVALATRCLDITSDAIEQIPVYDFMKISDNLLYCFNVIADIEKVI